MRNFSRIKTGSKPVLVAAVLGALATTALGCSTGGSSEAPGGGDEAVRQPATTVQTPEPTTGQTAEPRVTPTSGEETTSATGGDQTSDAPASRVLIRFQGEEGTRFSGTCSVNGEEEAVEGAVPERLSYQLAGDGEVSCNLTKEGDGRLRVQLESGDDSSVYEVTEPGSEISFTYSGSGLSSSTNSSSNSSTSSSTSSTRSVSSGSSSNSSSSSSVVVQQNSSQSSSDGGSSE
ncbi:hypothetical protein [Rubrobacter indicoceani]|uniref:hypothetical protein n=1 Tax=Rubrobacter indicoceani TaxID=2051957 RepID=UPI000E5AAD92|nr:hypothetical protein [Rubrobacter indicoceani]